MRNLSSDPLRNFKFIVQIVPPNNNVPASIQSMGFMTADGFSIQNEVISYREGGDNTTSLPLDTPILTTSGWKPLGELEIGDRLIDPYGEESKVNDLLPVEVKDTYEVTIGDGSSLVACFGHLWEYRVRDFNNHYWKEIGTTLDMKAYLSRGYQVVLPRMQPAQFDPGPELPLDPYILGVLLSEGSLEEEGVSFGQEEANTEIIDRVRASLPEGHSLRPKYQDGKILSWRITVGNDSPGPRNTFGRNKVLHAVREMGLIGRRAWEKFIPEPYLWASVEDRLALLQGILDGDGWVDTKHGARFASTSKALAEGVQHLIRSLGGRCGRLTVSTERTYRSKGEMRDARDVYEFSGISDLEFVPFTLPRKVDRFRCSPKTGTQFRRVRSVSFVGPKEVRCIEVTADSHLYIARNYMISHNTRKLPGQTDYGPITFGRGMLSAPPGATNVTPSNGYETYTWLSQVFSVVAGGGAGPPGQDFRTNIVVDVLDHPVTQGQSSAGLNNPPPVRARFTVYNAWPMAMQWSGLDAGGNAVMIESLQIAHEGFFPEYGSTSPTSSSYYLPVTNGF